MESTVVREKFNVEGMHCASCASSLETYLTHVKGVDDIKVNIVGHTALIAYDTTRITPEELDKKAGEIGYSLNSDVAESENSTSNQRKQKVLVAGALSVLVVIIAMVLPFDIPGSAWIQGALATIVLAYAGSEFFANAWSKIRHGQVSMDTLVALSTGTAYLVSVFNTIYPEFMVSRGLPAHLYYESAMVIITFILFGRFLEERARTKTSEAVRQLIGLQPSMMTVRRDGSLMEISIAEAHIGDIAIIRPGERVPVDGEVTAGESYVDESMISGEPVPEGKKKGSHVFTGTLNQQGYLEARITSVGKDTLLQKIIMLVEEALASKAPVQNKVDKIASVFVPAVLAIAAVSALLWLLLGPSPTHALVVFITVLVVACPCALGLATPTALTVGIGAAAGKGILVRNAAALENIKSVDTLVLDKTGTITKGHITVTQSHWKPGIDLDAAASRWKTLEEASQHPIAQAIVIHFEDIESTLLFDFENLSSGGVKARVKQTSILSGNKETMEKAGIDVYPEWLPSGREIPYIYYAEDDRLLGACQVEDEIRPNSAAIIDTLKAQHIRIVMITGDVEKNARQVAEETGITEVFAGVPADKKGEIIQKLQQRGAKVAMIGDGINDAHALAVADAGIALSSGTDIAMSSADVTLLGEGFEHLPYLFRISGSTLSTVNQNLFWAFIYNIIAIPIAAGVLYPMTGTLLSPMIAGAAMALSSLSVVFNSLLLKVRLN